LILDENEIKNCDIISNSSLKILSLNKNKLKNCEGIKNLTSLEELSITENESLVSLRGLNNLPYLKKLILTGSKIANLKDFPDLPSLEVLSLEGNAISSLADLKKIGHLKNLKELNMSGCPISEEKADEFKKEVLIELMHKLKQLKKINGDGWEPELVADVNAEKL
jgi:Leucine-rich repeat (LRR) protein